MAILQRKQAPIGAETVEIETAAPALAFASATKNTRISHSPASRRFGGNIDEAHAKRGAFIAASQASPSTPRS